MRNNAGNVITFPIAEPNVYTVEWGGSAMNAMYVFANAIDYDAPTQSTDTVKYIGPGGWIFLPPDFIQPGAEQRI